MFLATYTNYFSVQRHINCHGLTILVVNKHCQLSLYMCIWSLSLCIWPYTIDALSNPSAAALSVIMIIPMIHSLLPDNPSNLNPLNCLNNFRVSSSFMLTLDQPVVEEKMKELHEDNIDGKHVNKKLLSFQLLGFHQLCV